MGQPARRTCATHRDAQATWKACIQSRRSQAPSRPSWQMAHTAELLEFGCLLLLRFFLFFLLPLPAAFPPAGQVTVLGPIRPNRFPVAEDPFAEWTAV